METIIVEAELAKGYQAAGAGSLAAIVYQGTKISQNGVGLGGVYDLAIRNRSVWIWITGWCVFC